jgi:hypothetical protein
MNRDGPALSDPAPAMKSEDISEPEVAPGSRKAFPIENLQLNGVLKYATMGSECRNGVLYTLLGLRVPGDTTDCDAEGWPHIQRGGRGSITIAGEQQVQMAG